MSYVKDLLIRQMEEDERKAALDTALAQASGPALAVAVSSALVTFAELVEVGLPRGDRHAELAMLYRADCSVDFLRSSRFTFDVLRDPALPLTTARAVLKSSPSALEIRILSRRKDIPSRAFQLAAETSRARARARGQDGADYAALACLPAGWLELAAKSVDADIVNILRNPNCPEEVVRRHVTSGSARVRHQALAVTRRRALAIESSLICAARDLPMIDSARFPMAGRVQSLANRILATR